MHSTVVAIKTAALALLFTASAATAQTITYQFSGTLQDPFGSYPVGTPFTGSFTYEAGQADQTPDMDRGDFLYSNVTLSIGSDTVSDNGTGVINLYDNSFYPTDLFHLYTFNLSGSIGGLTLAPGAGLQVVLQDVTGAAFGGASSLPGPELVATSFTGDGATFIELRANGCCASARGWLTLLTAAEPEADAGPDQSIDEFAEVVLDGSESTGVPSSPITAYTWSQVAGTPVVLVLDDPARPRFHAPSVPAGGETLTFQLMVTSAGLTSDPDTVNVTVVNQNHPPTAVADADAASVNEGAVVELTGASSFDEDGESLTFEWFQTGGPALALSDRFAVAPTFTAPTVPPAGVELTFRLTVSDGLASGSDEVTIRVENVNHAPVADAGADQTVNENAVVTLEGTASDPDDDLVTFLWQQVAGPAVQLNDPTQPSTAFTAPAVEPGGAEAVFRLGASDGFVTSFDTVRVLFQNVNDPPVCHAARPTETVLWPPNHKLVPVGIVGVSDPNDDPTTIQITGVMQDESTNGTGDGDTGPDAVVQNGSVLLRAERSGGGNGRVYRVAFTATDAQGGACSGVVRVTVPHNPKKPAIEGTIWFDSTQP